MEIRQLVGQLMNKNIMEYLADAPEVLFPIPRLYPPATAAQIAVLERRAGQQLAPGYREFLSLTDGMDGFYLTMPLFGCHNWDEGSRASAGLAFLDGVREDGTAGDVGLPADIALFPVSINADRAQAIFMLDNSDVLPERFWWIGEGSSSFFDTFGDVLGYAIDPRSYSPREYVD
ncbi:SMI1/KNR4 family protein [Streptomyces sp. HUAS ZL42]|uniref:SMI1/KNR4 family protein n=1 Tax=Streptomyces sp. HUAS ZL42 TaxID=3231715 RepID=UPI00345E18C6